MSVDAYRVNFSAFVVAESPAEANERVRVWRALATAAGFDPGAGRTARVSQPELERMPILFQAVEKERVKRTPAEANWYLRKQAVEAIASHLDGDLDAATRIVKRLAETSQLTEPVARALTGIQQESGS